MIPARGVVDGRQLETARQRHLADQGRECRCRPASACRAAFSMPSGGGVVTSPRSAVSTHAMRPSLTLLSVSSPLLASRACSPSSFSSVVASGSWALRPMRASACAAANPRRHRHRVRRPTVRAACVGSRRASEGMILSLSARVALSRSRRLSQAAPARARCSSRGGRSPRCSPTSRCGSRTRSSDS